MTYPYFLAGDCMNEILAGIKDVAYEIEQYWPQLVTIVGGMILFGVVAEMKEKHYLKTRPVKRGEILHIDKSDPRNYKLSMNLDNDPSTVELVFETGYSDAYKALPDSYRKNLAPLYQQRNQETLASLDEILVPGAVLEIRFRERHNPKTVLDYTILPIPKQGLDTLANPN